MSLLFLVFIFIFHIVYRIFDTDGYFLKWRMSKAGIFNLWLILSYYYYAILIPNLI